MEVELEQVTISSYLPKNQAEEQPTEHTKPQTRTPNNTVPRRSTSQEDFQSSQEDSSSPKNWYDDYKCGTPYEGPSSHPKVDGDSWEKLHSVVKGHDKYMCDAWVDEIQNLLVLAGLFSAIVTAFVIESQKLLQEDPNTTSALLLVHIASQLSGNTSSQFTIPSTTLQPFNESLLQAFRINSLLFTSLVISLTTASFGILVLQWIRSYRTQDTRSYEDLVSLRQSKYEGLIKWKVPEIVAALPMLLQLGLVVFFVGLVDFLHLLYPSLAIVIGVFVGAVILSLIITTILPALTLWPGSKEDCAYGFGDWLDRRVVCAYQSPQSWFFSKAVLWIHRHTLGRVEFAGGENIGIKPVNLFSSWNDAVASRSKLRSWTPDAVYWVFKNFRHTPEPFRAAYHSLMRLSVQRKAMVIHNLLNDPTNQFQINNKLSRSGWVYGKVPSEELRKDINDERYLMNELLSAQLLTIWNGGNRYIDLFQSMYDIHALQPHHVECALRCLATLETNPSLERRFRERVDDVFFTSIRGNLPLTVHSYLYDKHQHSVWYFCCSILMDQERFSTYDMRGLWSIFWRILFSEWDKLVVITPDKALEMVHERLTTPNSPISQLRQLLEPLFWDRTMEHYTRKLTQNSNFLACLDFLMSDGGGRVRNALDMTDLMWPVVVDVHGMDAKYKDLPTLRLGLAPNQ